MYPSISEALRNVMSIEDSIFNPFLQEWERGALLGKARRYRVRPSDRLLNPRRSPSYVLSPYRTSGFAWELFCEVRMCHEGEKKQVKKTSFNSAAQKNNTEISGKISNHSFRDACFRLNTKANSQNDVNLHLPRLVGSNCARNLKSRGLPSNKFRPLN